MTIIEADFMAEGAPQKIAGAALKALGSVDILINNAGGSRAFTLESTEAQWEEAMTLNFTRPRQLADALIDGMIARGFGRIITQLLALFDLTYYSSRIWLCAYRPQRRRTGSPE